MTDASRARTAAASASPDRKPDRTRLAGRLATEPAELPGMHLEISEVITPVLTGLAGMIGVYAAEDVLGRLRRRGWCPRRWR